MEANFENSEIQRISYQEDGFVIHTKKESNTILYKELLDIDIKELNIDDEMPSAIGALLATAVGFSITGDATGIVGAPVGWGVVNWAKSFFGDDKKCLFTFKLTFDKKISFVTESDFHDSSPYSSYRYYNITKNYNKYFSKVLDIQNKIFENWKGALKKYDKYLSLSETLSLTKNPNTVILSDDLKHSGCFNKGNHEKVETYFKNKYSFNSERLLHNDDYIYRNLGNHYLKGLIESQKKICIGG